MHAGELEMYELADPEYVYCVVRKNYDMRKHEVWFTAHQGQKTVGQSRITFLGDLKHIDRDVETVYTAFVQTLVNNGWEPVTGEQKEPIKTFRKRAAPP